MVERTIRTMFHATPPNEVQHRGEILVIGLGRFGSSLASTLVEMGHEVLGVDADPTRVQEHAATLTQVVQADTTSTDALRQIGAGDVVTAVVCIGTDLESSVLTTVALVDLGVRNIWAKAITAAHGHILRRVGAGHVVFPEAEMGARVAHLVTGQMLQYFTVDDDFVLAELISPRELTGIPLGNSDLRAKYRVTVVCVKPAGSPFTYADRETVLGPDDLIVIAGHRSDVERFTKRG